MSAIPLYNDLPLAKKFGQKFGHQTSGQIGHVMHQKMTNYGCQTLNY